MGLSELIERCKGETSCEECSRKNTDCAKFKRVLKTISEPWEWNRMEEAFNDEKMTYRGGKYAGIALRCEHCRRQFDVPYRHYLQMRGIDGDWDSEDWDECPYCHKIITSEWLDKLKEENKK